MATAKEVLKDIGISSAFVGQKNIDICEAKVKAYGKQCAENALKVAAKKAKVLATKGEQKEVSRTVHPHFDGWSVTVDEESIISTPIETP